MERLAPSGDPPRHRLVEVPLVSSDSSNMLSWFPMRSCMAGLRVIIR